MEIYTKLENIQIFCECDCLAFLRSFVKKQDWFKLQSLNLIKYLGNLCSPNQIRDNLLVKLALETYKNFHAFQLSKFPLLTTNYFSIALEVNSHYSDLLCGLSWCINNLEEWLEHH